MFHLYFGAFDLVLYLGGIYAAMTLAKAICDQMDAAEASQAADQREQTVDAARTMAPMQPIPAHLSAPAARREDVSVKVSINS